MHRQSRRVAVAMVALTLSGPGFAGRGTDGELASLAADDPAVVARGEAVYAAQCASCHGADLEGQPDWRSRDAAGLLPAPPHDASGHTWHHDDDLLFEIVKYGPGAIIDDPTYASAMPAYEGQLSDADIIAALSFIKSTWPADERGWQEEVNASQLEQLGLGSGDSTLDKLFK